MIHGHGDHFLSLSTPLKRFLGATAIATLGTLAHMEEQISRNGILHSNTLLSTITEIGKPTLWTSGVFDSESSLHQVMRLKGLVMPA